MITPFLCDFHFSPVYSPVLVLKKVLLILLRRCNSPTDVALVLSHAEVSLHVVSGVSQLSSCKVADFTHEGLGSCKTTHGEFISNNNVMFEGKKWPF